MHTSGARKIKVKQSVSWWFRRASTSQLIRHAQQAEPSENRSLRQPGGCLPAGEAIAGKGALPDIIMLRQLKQILEERLRNAEELAKMYAKRLQTGDANALETNKINLELLNVKTEVSLNETALRNKLQELSTLNGNLPVVFEESQYPPCLSRLIIRY